MLTEEAQRKLRFFTTTPGHTLTLTQQPGQTKAQVLAEEMVAPFLSNTLATLAFTSKINEEHHNLTACLTASKTKAQELAAGNTTTLEATLISQANTLNAIFTTMTQRGEASGMLSSMDTYLRLAFKAQAQCRATLQTLADLKNPRPVAFVQQANIAGMQQVNNFPDNFSANELLEPAP
ncbi:MAG: hypothetical protein ACK5O1_04570 [Holosporales bacterium]